MTVLSICIPTFNRADYLRDCLQSIFQKNDNLQEIEVCVSDNASTDNTVAVINDFRRYNNFSYQRNEDNLGIPMNFLKVTSMASGRYIWLLGDDDVVTTDGISHILNTVKDHRGVDFFLFNCLNLKNRDLGYVTEYHKKQVFWKSDFTGECRFIEIIENNITFDHLGGMYLSIFKKDLWDGALDALDAKKIMENLLFSNHDNTFPHVRIFAKAFMNSDAFVSPEIICYSFSDAREWHPYYPLVRTFRLLESLDVYEKYGLRRSKYIQLRNESLKYFIEDFIKIFFLTNKYFGAEYLSKRRVILENAIYRGFWTSIIFLAYRLIIKMLIKLKR